MTTLLPNVPNRGRTGWVIPFLDTSGRSDNGYSAAYVGDLAKGVEGAGSAMPKPLLESRQRDHNFGGGARRKWI